MVTPTSHRQNRDTDNGSSKKSPMVWVLVALAVVALLLLIAFGLDWIAVDSAGGDVDVETPNTDVELDGPDVDVDVDGEVQGDAEADASPPS